MTEGPFDRIYVISLPSRTDRRREMDAQLRRLGLTLASPEVRLFDAIKPESAGDFPTVGTRGCYLSHLAVLRDAVRDGLDAIAIFEDDLDFTTEAASAWPLPFAVPRREGAAMAYGGHLLADTGPKGWIELAPATPVQTAHCVFFYGSAIAACATYLEQVLGRPPGHPDGGPMHVDGAYTWFRRSRPDLRTLAHMPPLGRQRSSRTDIHERRWYDNTPVAREIVGLLRRARNGWRRLASPGQ